MIDPKAVSDQSSRSMNQNRGPRRKRNPLGRRRMGNLNPGMKTGPYIGLRMIGNCLGKRLPLKEPGKKPGMIPSGMNNTSCLTYSTKSAYVCGDKKVNDHEMPS